MLNWTEYLYFNKGKMPVVYVVNKIARHGNTDENFVKQIAEKYNANYYYLNFKRCYPQTLREPFEDLAKRLYDLMN